MGAIIVKDKPKRGEPISTGGKVSKRRRSREYLSKIFAEALADDFSHHGQEAIEACRMFHPDRYLNIIASLMPKEVKVSNEEQMSDGELESALKRLLIADLNRAVEEREGRFAKVIEGERTPEAAE